MSRMNELAQTEMEYFQFLDDLRDSGITNMLLAPQYLEKTFEIPRAEAKELAFKWMKGKHNEKA